MFYTHGCKYLLLLCTEHIFKRKTQVQEMERDQVFSEENKHNERDIKRKVNQCGKGSPTQNGSNAVVHKKRRRAASVIQYGTNSNAASSHRKQRNRNRTMTSVLIF